MMPRSQVILRIREKLAKLHYYNGTAVKMWGPEIAKDMYQDDLEFYSSLLVLIGETKE